MWLVYHLLQPPVKRSTWLRFAVTLTSLAGAFGLRTLLDPWLSWQSPFALLLPAVLVSAWYGGARAGLLATAVGGIGAVRAFMAPDGLIIDNISDAVAFLLFIAEGTLISGICGVLHHAVNRARTSATEAARKFEIMANNAPVLIWSTDPADRSVFFNRNWLTFTGRTWEEELAAGRFANVHPDDLKSYQRTCATAAAQKQPYQVEYRLRRIDGTHRWLLEHAVPRYDADGRFDGFIGSCTDITASRREREELIFVARLQRKLGASLDLERIADALAEATVPRLADWFSLQRVSQSGRLEIVRTHQADDQSAANAAAFLRSAAAVIETGEARFTPCVDAGFFRAGAADEADLARLREMRLVSHLAVPLRARGRITGVLTLATAGSGRIIGPDEVALVRKIAGIAGFALDNALLYRRTLRALAAAEEARRQMSESERALEQQRALLQTIIDSVPALIAYVNPDGRLLLHNEKYREWLGVEPSDSRRLSDGRAGGTGDKTAAGFAAALAGETVCYEEMAGADRQVAATLRPDRDPAGRVRGVVFHAYDITERNRAYAELAIARELLRCHADELEARVRQRTATLRETNAELEAFTYSVSHDLRTPLQFVRSFAEAIEEDQQSRLTLESSGYLRRIIRAAERMESMIHDLLGYSRVARADVSLTLLPLDEAVAEVLGHHQTMIQRTGAQLQVASPLPRVLADRVGLFQALSNLIANSLKFVSADRTPLIRVRAECGSGSTRLWVEDNGIGIHARHHEKIFKLFERLHSVSEYPGTGIGLALVRKVVHRMGGRCGVESAPDIGSRFWIDFPVADDPQETGPVASGTEPALAVPVAAPAPFAPPVPAGAMADRP